MKIRITAGGIYGATGEVPVGTEFDLNGEPPAGWKGRYTVISKGPAKGAQPVTNEPPALSGKNKAELLKIAADEGVAVSDDDTNADIVSAIELAREEKAKA